MACLQPGVCGLLTPCGEDVTAQAPVTVREHWLQLGQCGRKDLGEEQHLESPGGALLWLLETSQEEVSQDRAAVSALGRKVSARSEQGGRLQLPGKPENKGALETGWG